MGSGSGASILLLPMSLGIGGAETHVVSLAAHLKARGWNVCVASGGGALVNRLTDAQIEHVWTPLDSRSPFKMLNAYRTVLNIARSRRVDLIHAHARIPAYLGAKVCRSLNIPMVVTYHGTFVSGPFWNLFTRPGDRTIAVSPDVKEYTVAKFGFRPDRVTVIPNGIDLDAFPVPSDEDRNLARSNLSVPEWADKVILYESRLDPELAPVAQAAIDAAALLRATYPNLYLLVAGDGKAMQTVKNHAAKVNGTVKANGGAKSNGDGEAKQVVGLTGYLTDTFQAYAASDLVIGMSRVALEAMATERPVIIAGPGGVFGPAHPDAADVMEDRNYTSRDAPHPLSAERLAEECHALLRDDGYRQALGRLGRETVSARHSMILVAELTENVYEETLSARKRSPAPPA